jgi:hypothetical protein
VGGRSVSGFFTFGIFRFGEDPTFVVRTLDRFRGLGFAGNRLARDLEGLLDLAFGLPVGLRRFPADRSIFSSIDFAFWKRAAASSVRASSFFARFLERLASLRNRLRFCF